MLEWTSISFDLGAHSPELMAFVLEGGVFSGNLSCFRVSI